ncbi:MAG: efflux RND transporter permease subunit [Spongiibacteraceae bacterium]
MSTTDDNGARGEEASRAPGQAASSHAPISHAEKGAARLFNLSQVFIERPVATALLALALVLIGALSYVLLPVAPLPEVDFPTIQVTANLPGASPETMASSVSTPLERAFGNISGIDQMNSASNQGNSYITLQFNLDKDINDAAREVQAAINASRHLLPSGMPGNPRYQKFNPSQTPIMVLALSSPTLSSGEIYDIASSVLAQKIAQIVGVGQVELRGGSLPAVRIALDPRALNHYSLALDQVRTAIAETNTARPKGSLEATGRQWQIAANDQLRSAAEYRQLIVSDAARSPVRLGDVAAVTDSVEDRRASGFHNHSAAVMLIISRQPNANIVATVDAIRAQLPALQALLPASVEMNVTIDRSPGIRATLREAQHTLIIAVALVIGVVLLFIGNLRAALIPTLAVPVSLIGAFTVMYLCDFSLNNLSLMAVIVAAGLVVDDAIVVMENISRHIERGSTPMRAALDGTREVGFTLLSMNLALVVVFISILFMGGFIERLFREFSLTLIATIVVSLLVSLSLTPMLCARLLRIQPTPIKKIATGVDGHWLRKLQAGYHRSLGWALAHSRLVLALLLITIGLNVYLYIAIPKTFLPEQDTGQLQGFARGDDALSFMAMQPKVDAYRALLLNDPAVADVVGSIGGDNGINNAFMLVRLKPVGERKESSREVINRLRANQPKLPGGRFFLAIDQDIQLDNQRGRGTGERLSLLASESELLRTWAPRVYRALQSVPELVDLDGRADEGALQVQLDIDREAAKRLGVDIETVTQVLNNSFSQRQVATLYDELNQYRVVMELAPEFTQTPDVLNEVYVITKDHRRVPLSAFSTYRYGTATDRIRHEGQFAAESIGFNLAPGVSIDQAQRAIQRAVAQTMMPNAVQLRFGGAGAALEKTQGNQPILLLGVILTVYIVLGILYESYVHPLTILSTLPSAGVGALLALLALDTDFSLISLLGLFLLIGIVMKNAILIIDFALSAERERGLSPRAAIFEAAQLRFRPILMTSAAALFGALPLMFGSGDGAEMRRPLGITIVGGLVVSQLLTLYTTPVIYLYLDRFRLWAQRRWRLSAVAAPVNAAEKPS